MLTEAFVKVDDRKIQQIRWADNCLFIRFSDEKSNIFYDVPAGLFIAMIASDSVFNYYEEHIEGKFDSKQGK